MRLDRGGSFYAQKGEGLPGLLVQSPPPSPTSDAEADARRPAGAGADRREGGETISEQLLDEVLESVPERQGRSAPPMSP